MRSEVFLDTNILLYAVDAHDPRNGIATQLMAEGGTISVQVLNEFASVARRKFGWPWKDIAAALSALRALCGRPRSLEPETHDHALRIAARDGLNIYDSLLLASALQAGCRMLLSEDMQHGRQIEGRLTIRNPFAS